MIVKAKNTPAFSQPLFTESVSYGDVKYDQNLLRQKVTVEKITNAVRNHLFQCIFILKACSVMRFLFFFSPMCNQHFVTRYRGKCISLQTTTGRYSASAISLFLTPPPTHRIPPPRFKFCLYNHQSNTGCLRHLQYGRRVSPPPPPT